MNEQDRFKEIAKVAADANRKLVYLTLKVAENGMYFEDLQVLVHQLGYIEGLSYVPEEEE